MARGGYLEWYNENGGRGYPIAEEATRVDDNGRRMPDDILVDMGILVPPEHKDLYVSSVRITRRTLSIGVSSPVSGVLIGTYARSDIAPLRAFPLTSVTDDVAGWVVFGNHFLRPTVVDAYHRFSAPSQSGLEQRVMRLVESLPVTSLQRYGGQSTRTVDKVVELRAGGALIVERHETEEDTIVIRLAPGAGTRFAGPCLVDAVKEKCGVPPMRSINGVCPDEDGKITVRFE
jgi:hypothetical protein